MEEESLELATLKWVHWFNHQRLLEPIGYIPPAEAEANYWRQLAENPQACCLNLNQLASTKPGAIHNSILIMYKNFFWGVFSCFFAVICSAQEEVCDQSNGANSFDNLEFEKAFEFLQGCEKSPDASGRTLAMLAYIYIDDGLKESPLIAKVPDRAARAIELFKRSAVTGQLEAVDFLIGVYAYGDEGFSIAPEPEKAECMRLLVDSGTPGISGSEVQKCLNL